jgi:hypothetical protein
MAGHRTHIIEFKRQVAQELAGLDVVTDDDCRFDDVGADLFWYGYAFEAIYIVIGTLLTATVPGVLIYH